ncbi:DUF1178 family protein [Trinickia sp.]|uniref:DUF1178 family protein n=1 Tax=Trinickia sp. TaxID=2571163 RepID=UPI003F7EB9C0
MKVLDLQCPLGHRFEGWFGSDGDFESQLSRKLIECPICSATEVSRMPSAPRLNLSGATRTRQGGAQARDEQGPQGPQGAQAGEGRQPEGVAQVAQRAREFEAMALRMLREVVGNAENVGDRFAEEARRIHYNEAPARSIRGVTTPEDARALVDEGIEVMAVPGACVPKESLQ